MYPYTYGWNKKKVQFRESTDHYTVTVCLNLVVMYLIHCTILSFVAIALLCQRLNGPCTLDRTDSSSLAECAKIGGILANVYYLWSVDTSLCLLFLSSRTLGPQ